MNAHELRQAYFNYFLNKQHQQIPRANIVPSEDPTTLFTGSGMQPLLPYLLGSSHPSGKRLVNSQTCFRAEDIDEVGDNRHTTFFEMLGNWSLGDYFKQEQLTWFFEFLLDEAGLDIDKLYVTCFIGSEGLGIPKDDESAAIWQRLFRDRDIEAEMADIGSETDGYGRGMKPGERIFFYDASKNWWSRTGEPLKMPEGEPGGPDSEVFYDFGTPHNQDYGKHCHPNCDCGRFLEIGNSVFMQYVKTAQGFAELPQKNVDFGGGLERIVAAQANDPDIFKINLLLPLIETIGKISKKEYEDNQEAFRIIADHTRSAVFMATDGVAPSNTAQGYVLRRLIRRAIRQALALGIETDLLKRVAPVVLKEYQQSHPEVKEQFEDVLAALEKEEKVFRQTLRRGVKEFDKLTNQTLNGETVFKLFDTYGFPAELSIEEAKQRGITIQNDWQERFDDQMQQQRERSRTASQGQFKGGLGGESEMHKKYHTATHLMYKALRMVLGEHVVQRGSNVTDERLRFDFSHPEKMTDEEKRQVEEIVNAQIEKNLQVSWHELPTKEALTKGAMGAFGDKYGETVKVYSIGKPGEEPFSFEICGGPHVENIGQLAASGKFKIKKEESSSAGVRRIKAVLE